MVWGWVGESIDGFLVMRRMGFTLRLGFCRACRNGLWPSGGGKGLFGREENCGSPAGVAQFWQENLKGLSRQEIVTISFNIYLFRFSFFERLFSLFDISFFFSQSLNYLITILKNIFLSPLIF